MEKLRNREEVIKKVSEELIRSIENLSAQDLVIAFSGGIDSSLLAFLIKNYSSKVKNILLVYTGLEDTHDFLNSRDSAKKLSIPLEQHILNREDVLRYKEEIGNIINSKDLVEISYLIPFYAVLGKVKQKVIVTGQGSDELFMGYHKFFDCPEKAQALSKSLYTNLWLKLPKREYLLAEKQEKELILPFMSKNLEKLVMPLGLGYKIVGERNKILLREAAKYLGLPESIANKPKKAAQYGSGVWKVLVKEYK